MTQASIRLRLHCPHCPAHIDCFWQPDGGLVCPRCRAAIALRAGDAAHRERRLDACAVCGSTELYRRKDFPQGLGLAIVVVAACLSFILLTRYWFAAWGVLLAAVALDVLLYVVVGMVTCCYRCKSEYRGLARDDRHGAFDLATAEKYI